MAFKLTQGFQSYAQHSINFIENKLDTNVIKYDFIKFTAQKKNLPNIKMFLLKSTTKFPSTDFLI